MCMTEHSDVKRSGSTYKVGFFSLSSFFLTRFFVCLIFVLTYHFLAFLFCVCCRSFWRTQSTFAACLARTGSRALRALAFWKASSPSRWATTSRATPCASPSAMLFKDLDDVVVWDTRDKKRNAAAALTVDAPPAPPKKMRAIFCLTSREWFVFLFCFSRFVWIKKVTMKNLFFSLFVSFFFFPSLLFFWNLITMAGHCLK